MEDNFGPGILGGVVLIDPATNLPYKAVGSGGGGGPVTSVAGRTGIVTLTKTDVSLDLVDNTADSAKPVSGPQATALAGKLPQSLSGDPARFRGVYETAPESLPDPQDGDWIIILTAPEG